MNLLVLITAAPEGIHGKQKAVIATSEARYQTSRSSSGPTSSRDTLRQGPLTAPGPGFERGIEKLPTAATAYESTNGSVNFPRSFIRKLIRTRSGGGFEE